MFSELSSFCILSTYMMFLSIKANLNEIKSSQYRPCPAPKSLFTFDSQHPPRSRHAVYLGVHVNMKPPSKMKDRVTKSKWVLPGHFSHTRSGFPDNTISHTGTSPWDRLKTKSRTSDARRPWLHEVTMSHLYELSIFWKPFSCFPI